MNYREHLIEIYVNGEKLELKDQKSLNLRLNNVLFDPTKTTSTQAEYSYSFGIPSTPNNDRIFGFANNLGKANKFHARYASQVYADGDQIFDGSLTIQQYSAADKEYTCNFVNIKVNTLEDIFGDDTLTDLHWDIDFDGAPTINEVNNDGSTKYYFPLVSYGVFQKDYVSKDEIAAEYTPKHQMDKYNKWWIESFYPSLNMMETLRRAFQSRGYVVGGSAFSDPNINEIFCSTNLAQEQVPLYNIGNQRFGNCSLKVQWNNYNSVNTAVDYDGGDGWRNSTGGWPQDLEFPYYRIDPAINSSNSEYGEQYNFSTIDIWNMMDSKNNPYGVNVTVQSPTYMYDPNEMLIVIPADGWYRIYLSAKASLSGAGTSFTAKQWTNTFQDGDEFAERNVQIKRGFNELTPLEIQLIRNYDSNVELIKGKRNITYDTGDPNQESYTIRGRSYTGATVQNKKQWDTDFPHQALAGSWAPTIMSGLVVTTSSQMRSGRSGRHTIDRTAQSGTNTPQGQSGRRPTSGTSQGGGYGGGSTPQTRYNTYGYIHHDGYPMPYDPAVSKAFICGFSTLGDGTVSVQKNGYSWSRMCSVRNRCFADVRGMDLYNKKSDGTTEILTTEYNKNTYDGGRAYYYGTDSSMNNAIIDCCVYLNKDDVLELVAIQRDYYGQKYACSAECEVQITAISERSEEELRADPYWNAYSPTEFPKKLNLFNFTNKETRISDWINNVQKAFNLEFVQNGNVIDINTRKGLSKNVNYAVDIDDKVNSGNAVAEYISYPREMSVQYKIDTDEWGFELTVPPEHINDEGDEWKKWGDSGFTIIQLNDDTYETSTQNTQTSFSYTWYDDFLWKDVNEDGTESDFSGYTISIPVIEKAEFMAEGYGYEEAMKHDGYSLTQRFWYRQQISQEYIWLSDHMHEKIFLTYPSNTRGLFNLSYKDTEKSLVTEYFNVTPMLASNYVEVDVYLTPEEYRDLKNGALCRFDKDLYYVVEIKGYDCTGFNETTLKLMKKVI